MIVMPKPVSPPPVIRPSSPWVKPNCAPQSARMPLRMENPTPAATRVRKPAQNKRCWPATALFAGAPTVSTGLLRLSRLLLRHRDDVDGFVAADGFEVEQNSEVNQRHGRGDERIGHQRSSVAVDAGLVHGPLVGAEFFQCRFRIAHAALSQFFTGFL